MNTSIRSALGALLVALGLLAGSVYLVVTKDATAHVQKLDRTVETGWQDSVNEKRVKCTYEVAQLSVDQGFSDDPSALDWYMGECMLFYKATI